MSCLSCLELTFSITVKLEEGSVHDQDEKWLMYITRISRQGRKHDCHMPHILIKWWKDVAAAAIPCNRQCNNFF